MRKKLVIIGQNEWGTVKNPDNIMTYGVNLCCALFIYNDEKTALAHVDALTDMSFIKDMFDEFKNSHPKVILFYRNGKLHTNIASELKRICSSFEARNLKDKPNIMIKEGVLSFPDPKVVSGAFNNPDGISNFLGFQSDEIEVNGRDFLERVKYNHNLILNCMFSAEKRQIVRVCRDSIFEQQAVELLDKAKAHITCYNKRGGDALLNRLATKKSYNTSYTEDDILYRIAMYSEIFGKQGFVSNTSLSSNTLSFCTKVTIVALGVAVLAIALSSYYTKASDDVSR